MTFNVQSALKVTQGLYRVSGLMRNSQKESGFVCGISHHQILFLVVLQWGAAGAEIEVPSVENMALKGSPFKAWSRSVFSHSITAMLAIIDFFLANFYLSGPFTCIFSKTSPRFFLC